jgi:hypothetical protein
MKNNKTRRNNKPIIKAEKHIVEIKNGKKLVDVSQSIDNNIVTTTDNIKNKTIRQKVRFDENIISPRKGAKTSKPGTYPLPKSILRKTARKTKKILKSAYRIIVPKK